MSMQVISYGCDGFVYRAITCVVGNICNMVVRGMWVQDSYFLEYNYQRNLFYF
jgi:hypothetical protein